MDLSRSTPALVTARGARAIVVLPIDYLRSTAETRRAMTELDEGKDVTRYDDFDDFRTAMLGG